MPKVTPALIASLFISSIFLYGTYSNTLLLIEKKNQQIAALEEFQQWKNQYTRLQPLENQWTVLTHPISSIVDVFSLHHALITPPSLTPATQPSSTPSTIPPQSQLSKNLSFSPTIAPVLSQISPDTLTVSNVNPTTHLAKSVPSATICLSSSRSPGLTIRQLPSLSGALSSLEPLFSRPDFSFDAYEITLNPPQKITPTPSNPNPTPTQSYSLTLINACILAHTSPDTP